MVPMPRLLTALLVVLLLPATATAAVPACPPTTSEFGPGPAMGIGPEHVLGGVPERAAGAGGIVVREGRRTPRTVTLARVPGGVCARRRRPLRRRAGDRACSTARDSCADIVAGAPGRSGTGEAYLLLGSTGALPRAATVIRAPDGRAGRRVRRRRRRLQRRSPPSGTTSGSARPGRDVAGQADAGAIYHFKLGEMGEVVFAGVLTQGTPQVPDTPEAGDRLGELLAPVTGGVVAGLPHEDIGDRRDAGAIEQIRVAPDGTGLPGVFLDQSAGGLETPEAGDRFGAAVVRRLPPVRRRAGRGHRGPRRRRPDRRVPAHAGRHERARPPAPAPHLPPGRPRRPGPRGGGRPLRRALATGASLRCQEDSAIAVGVPGEDFRGLRNAGAVALIELDPGIGCRSRELIQGRGLPGRPHSGERTGVTLGIAPDRPGLDEDTFDTLLVGRAERRDPHQQRRLSRPAQPARRAARRARLRQRVRAAGLVTNVMPNR